MGSPFMLNPDWADPKFSEYLAPNCVAVAARELGVKDDRVRLAIAAAALREGKQLGEWEIATEVAAAAAGIDPKELLERARSADIEKKVRAETAEFHQLQVTQRPTFVLDTEIGDRAVFSGFARVGPIAAALDSMLDDADAYTSFAAHFGSPPP